MHSINFRLQLNATPLREYNQKANTILFLKFYTKADIARVLSYFESNLCILHTQSKCLRTFTTLHPALFYDILFYKPILKIVSIIAFKEPAIVRTVWSDLVIRSDSVIKLVSSFSVNVLPTWLRNADQWKSDYRVVTNEKPRNEKLLPLTNN